MTNRKQVPPLRPRSCGSGRDDEEERGDDGTGAGAGGGSRYRLRQQQSYGRQASSALLHQQVLAGVGNVFKSEICFATGLNPFRTVSSLTPAQAAETIAAARKLVSANVLEDSGDAIVTYRGQRRRT